MLMRRLQFAPCAMVAAAARTSSTHFRETDTPHLLGKDHKKQKPPVREGEWEHPVGHAIWTKADLEAIKQTHIPPEDIIDKIALLGIKCLRRGFDVVSGYAFGHITERKLMRRILFLETAAGIPGMVAGTLRHLRSLRAMERDHGWIHTLLEEAENERMHMLTFMDLYRPGIIFRCAVLVTQGVFWNTFFLAYLLSPRLCHRFVGYLEEEAVRTYTDALAHMDSSDPKDASLHAFAKKPANDIAIQYWKMDAKSTMRDVVMAIRADEANHRDVNHTFAGMEFCDTSPFVQTESSSKPSNS